MADKKITDLTLALEVSADDLVLLHDASASAGSRSKGATVAKLIEGLRLVSSVDSLPIPTKEDYDRKRGVIYEGSLRIIDRSTLHPAVDGGVSFSNFASSNVGAGFTYRGVVSGVGLNDVPNPVDKQVVYYTDTHSFYSYDAQTLILGRPIGWIPYTVPNYIGFVNSLGQAINKVTANGQVIYRSDLSLLEISFNYRPSSAAVYRYQWVPTHDIQHALSLIADLNTEIEKLNVENIRIDILPAFIISGSFAGNYSLIVHGILDHADIAKIRIVAQGGIVHEEAWTTSSIKRSFPFNISSTEAGNISRNLRGRTTIEVGVLFLDSSDNTVIRTRLYEWPVLNAAPS